MPRRRRFAVPGQETIVASAARTTNGNSTADQSWTRSTGPAVAKLDVTAASGTTPQLTVVVEDSPDSSTWTVRDTFGVKTAISNEVRSLPGAMDVFQRVRWTITGTTPSFTFSVQFAASSGLLV